MPRTFEDWLPGQKKRTNVMSLAEASKRMVVGDSNARPVINTTRTDAEIEAAVAYMKKIGGAR